MVMRKNKGFTMVELLAVIVILGILTVMAISGVSSLINKAHSEQKVQQEKTLEMAAKSYIQANKSLAPKSIGESVEIPVADLKTARYIKEDIVNSKGESCMKESYVRVYKLSKSEYTYTSYLYCGNEKRPESTEVPVPTIEIYFTDANGVRDDSALTNVSEARFGMNITGGKTSSGEQLAIAGYNYTISVKTFKDNDDIESTSSTSAYEEVYSSGTLSVNNLKEFNIEKKIADYIDVTKVSSVSIKVTARNVAGGEKTILSSTEGTNNTISFKDTEKPECLSETKSGILNSKITGQAENDSDWINKSSAGNKVRKITAECVDGDGSQCIRDSFTRTWPNNYQTEAEYAYIQVEDNAGLKNVSDDYIKSKSICDKPLLQAKDSGYCLVRVNVDITRPTIKVSGYTVKPENISVDSNKNIKLPSGATNLITANNVTANNQNYTIQIGSDDYRNLSSKNGTKKWMNKDNYPNGITYVFEVSDNLHLDTWKWETNSANTKFNNNFSLTNPDASGEVKYFTQPENSNCGSLNDVIIVRLYGEGERGGILTVTDKAGNSSKIQVRANIDHTAPDVPKNITGYVWKSASSDNKGETYNFGTNEWKNRNVVAEITNYDKTKEKVSGFYNFVYKTDRKSNVNIGESVTIEDEGITKVSFGACDYAGNCSDYSAEKEVKIDKTAPNCNVTATKYENGSNKGTYTANSWLKDGYQVNLKATCSDVKKSGFTDTNISGCDTSPFEWTSVINQNYNANYGAKGIDAGGEVKDKAGNVTQCKTVKVKIDSTYPSCKNTKDNRKWTANDRRVEWWCEDKQSGCKDTSKSSADITTTTKTYTIKEHTIEDKAGNKVNCPATNVDTYVDKSAPTFNKWPDGDSCRVIEDNGNYNVVLNTNLENYYNLGEGNGSSDPHSGLVSKKYIFTTSTSKPNESIFNANGFDLGSDNIGSTNACNDKRIYAYIMLVDAVGNKKVMECGHYDHTCCSDSNYKGCNWVTSCRYGLTEIHNLTSTGGSGIVCHGKIPSSYWEYGNKSCTGSTKLYLVDGGISSGDHTNVCYEGGDGGSWVSPSSGKACGWIWNKCINQSNDMSITCSDKQCSG